MNQQVKKYCTIFGLSENFTENELKIAYRTLIFQWHPDRHANELPHIQEKVLEQAKVINAAFEHLSELLELGLISAKFESSNESVKKNYSYQTYKTQHSYKGKSYKVGFPDTSVIEIFLKSSHIISAGYNSKTHVLFIKFQGDQVYQYYDVPESIYNNFLNAESHGKFAHKNIYYNFNYDPC